MKSVRIPRTLEITPFIQVSNRFGHLIPARALTFFFQMSCLREREISGSGSINYSLHVLALSISFINTWLFILTVMSKCHEVHFFLFTILISVFGMGFGGQWTLFYCNWRMCLSTLKAKKPWNKISMLSSWLQNSCCHDVQQMTKCRVKAICLTLFSLMRNDGINPEITRINLNYYSTLSQTKFNKIPLILSLC